MKKLLTFALALVAAVAFAEDKVVEVSGMGTTYRAAVNEALITALEQSEGVSLSTSVRSQIQSLEASVSSTDGDSERVAINDSITKGLQKASSGKILGYEILSEDFDPVTKKYTVQLSVRMPGAYVVGLDPSNRRRMAVVPFRVATGDTMSWYGENESSTAWTKLLADKLNERLTQTRKFTMVDRKFDSEVNAELSRLTGANASVADAQRLNQKLGTDYLIVGEVRLFPVQSPGINPLTKQPLPMYSQKFAEVTYRVLLAPTGQLKWMDTITIDALDYPEPDIRSFASTTASAVASAIAEGVMGSILPLEIVAKTPSGLFVIGEGGKSVRVGERFTVYVLGETVSDTRLGEELDEIEDAVGTLEIVRVTAKMSYAKAIEGDASLMVVGSRLRRPEVVPAAQPPAPPPAQPTTQTLGNGGVVLPF